MANEHWKTFPPVRRVVTGHDANNVAKVLIDAPATNHKGAEGRSTLMWITDQNPADIGVGEKIEDMGARIVGTPPPPNGTRFCVIDFPPGNHPHMHRTETVDYVIVIDGEIEMDMDDSTVKLKAGRHPGPARHQPRLGQPQRQERARRLRAGRWRSRSASASRCWARPARADKEETHDPIFAITRRAACGGCWPLALARRGRRADLSERPGAADRADLARRRHRHHGAHRRAAADRERSRRPSSSTTGRRQRLGRRHRGGACAARRADAAGHLGRHHHRQPAAVEQARLQRQGLHADHRAVPRHAGAGGQCHGAGQQREGADRAGEGQARHAELRLLRRRHLRASQHGGFQAAHRHRHRAHPLSRRDAGRAGAARRRRLRCCCSTTAASRTTRRPAR